MCLPKGYVVGIDFAGTRYTDPAPVPCGQSGIEHATMQVTSKGNVGHCACG